MAGVNDGADYFNNSNNGAVVLQVSLQTVG